MPRFALLVLLPLLQGCIAFGYPSVTYTPEVTCLDEDVHAFKRSWGRDGTCMIMTGGEWIADNIEELPVDDGHLAGQRFAYFPYVIGGIPVSFSDSRSWSIILYRPGFEVVELPSRWWLKRPFESTLEKIDWKPALDLAAQINAIEQICSDPHRSIRHCSEHVRQFAAREYERLAASSLATPAERASLQEKAARVKEPDPR